MISLQPMILNVTQLNTYIKSIIDGDLNLSTVAVVGEISNFTNHYRTGHYYLTLKDSNASIKAVMFKTANQRLKFMPENGMKVICFGRISVFERDGVYQLYIEDMQPDGLGSLNLRYEQLKDKLEKEGLFSSENKKVIPLMPLKIGVITSPTGAAIRDILNILERRFPLCEVILAPVEVQGGKSAPGMIKALKKFEKLKCVDLIIIGRGGGSIEDLWSFNDEALAREIYKCSIPIISAVGHETDFTISDFVSDLRAPTPSAAAELAVPDIAEHKEYINQLSSVIKAISLNNIQEKITYIEGIKAKLQLLNPINVIENNISKISLLSKSLYRNYETLLKEKQGKVISLYNRLDSLNPVKVLLRGYSVALKDKKTINSVKNIEIDDEISVLMSDGRIKCKVKDKECL